MNVGFNPGVSNYSVDNSQIGQEFKDGLKNKTNDELVGMLGQKDLGPQAKLEVAKELLDRMNAKGSEGAGGAGGAGGGGEGGDLMDLLKKLMEGKISPEELKKLSGMLGVDVATLEKVKGSGENQGATSEEPDITGG
ncbi:hypothetical protein IP92_05486 [Pseudoduganella flava]|uniref:Uncharacterized protein n=1 Tax=Pseudoduganella flava TaxID=871742 RepID=A0A562PE58_9BURK|nr:hypothetical protein [Pseudoduganella flava]QGZ42119.1 hypothetical protein GO485_25795 [Pseudoduganella flava]TWI42510.1 hypothetical protein IP92_05486 [Pseudoduganella flava]